MRNRKKKVGYSTSGTLHGKKPFRRSVPTLPVSTKNHAFKTVS